MKQWLGAYHTELLNLAKAKYVKNGHAYHNWDHILFCLNEHAEHASSFVAPTEAFAALLFHDAIYDTHAKDNEIKSARFSSRVLHKYGFALPFTLHVSNSIVVTDHKTPTTSFDQDLTCDIDMSILGQDRMLFNAYCAGIAKEWSWVAPSAYVTGRKQFLEGLLGAKPIFRTPNYASLEAKARDNIRYAIRALK